MLLDSEQLTCDAGVHNRIVSTYGTFNAAPGDNTYKIKSTKIIDL